ncbi:hypothetical protein OHB41_48095 [Streptomyces sp. NBC_01571]|uniref:hypothetical protein n=1 Tax=Streptomyces sp. NBC_01571 TaxID=2975883 RepID=UPI002250CA86|nr:hypothetical protein [Streptomyces sp. NBC_01571]MCX4580750.1 hypothetical protein [Streptomyces sp. NBC_01571]
MASLGERLRHRKAEVFEDGLREAVMEGPVGEAELVSALADVPRSRHVSVVAVLGDAQGVEGPQVLRRILAADGMSRDTRCAAVLALAKRCGPQASADLVQALSSTDATVKNYAMVGLAGAGDDQGWEQAFVRLKQILRRPGPPPGLNPRYLSVQSPVAAAVCYLAGHLDGAGGERSVRLVGELRDHWDRLGAAEQEWLTDMWPGCVLEGPPAGEVLPPDSGRLQAWIRVPLFGPVH